MHFGIARHAKDTPFVEPDQRAGLAQSLVARERILEKVERERVDIEAGNISHCGSYHEGLLHNVLAERRAVSLCLKRAPALFDPAAQMRRGIVESGDGFGRP